MYTLDEATAGLCIDYDTLVYIQRVVWLFNDLRYTELQRLSDHERPMCQFYLDSLLSQRRLVRVNIYIRTVQYSGRQLEIIGTNSLGH